VTPWPSHNHPRRQSLAGVSHRQSTCSSCLLNIACLSRCLHRLCLLSQALQHLLFSSPFSTLPTQSGLCILLPQTRRSSSRRLGWTRIGSSTGRPLRIVSIRHTLASSSATPAPKLRPSTLNYKRLTLSDGKSGSIKYRGTIYHIKTDLKARARTDTQRRLIPPPCINCQNGQRRTSASLPKAPTMEVHADWLSGIIREQLQPLNTPR
jgi:hypothetical protein